MKRFPSRGGLLVLMTAFLAYTGATDTALAGRGHHGAYGVYGGNCGGYRRVARRRHHRRVVRQVYTQSSCCGTASYTSAPYATYGCQGQAYSGGGCYGGGGYGPAYSGGGCYGQAYSSGGCHGQVYSGGMYSGGQPYEQGGQPYYDDRDTSPGDPLPPAPPGQPSPSDRPPGSPNAPSDLSDPSATGPGNDDVPPPPGRSTSVPERADKTYVYINHRLPRYFLSRR